MYVYERFVIFAQSDLSHCDCHSDKASRTFARSFTFEKSIMRTDSSPGGNIEHRGHDCISTEVHRVIMYLHAKRVKSEDL